MPPLLLVTYVELIRRHASLGASVAAICAVLFCVSCAAAYGHVVNDWSDVADDLRAGKPNTMRDVGVGRRAALCACLVVAGFVVLAPFANAWSARIALAVNYLWPTLYSMPRVRLKERGLLGVLSDAAGSHITPTLFTFAVVSLFVPGPANVAVMTALLLWVTALGIKGILYHQIADRTNDEIAGVATFAAGFDARKFSAIAARYNLAFELPVSMFLTVAVGAFVPLAAVAIVVYLALECTKYVLGFEFAVSGDARLRRASVPFANEMFYTLWLPLAAAIQLALNGVSFAWIPVLHGLLFREQIAVQFGDARAVAAQLKARSAHLQAKYLRR
ncbi:MAG: UbiA family prenyltransferase [Candidatus Eremiobacteraeota bacterium]|nr:UbiA family prenyltransferase [Candidatus Eremiobacteraeota bacterium]